MGFDVLLHRAGGAVTNRAALGHPLADVGAAKVDLRHLNLIFAELGNPLGGCDRFQTFVVEGAVARPLGHDRNRQSADFLGLAPVGQVVEHVGPHEEEHLGVGRLAAKIAKRVDRVAHPASLQLEPAHQHAGIPRHRQFDHFRSSLPWRNIGALLMGRNRGRNEPDLVQIALFPGYVRQQQVAVVNRVESASKKSDSHDREIPSVARKNGTWDIAFHGIRISDVSPGEAVMDEQQSLFGLEPAPWEEDDRQERLVATVVFVGGAPGEYDYLVPDELAEQIQPGCRIRVPLGRGNRPVEGYCIRVEAKPPGKFRLKPIHSLVDRRALLSPSMLKLTEWISEHYLCDLGQVLETVIPAGVRSQAGTRVTSLLSIAPEAAANWQKLGLPPKQMAVMQALAAAQEPLAPLELARAAKCTQAPIKSLRDKGLIVAHRGRIGQNRRAEPVVERQDHLLLNTDQQRALDAILHALNSRRHETVLIHGVTGSGKTEVYIQVIQEVVHFGRQAIVLVPEISLTPQTVRRFRRRFEHVAVLHSHLSDADRHWEWQRIAEGRVQVVVGARSAVFAPVPNLGLIVLDEEHENSFKQETAPRYHARDVAIRRAAQECVPLVLGSATPSLESYHRAQQGEYRLIDMPRRVMGRPLPAVGTIDLRDEFRSKSSRGSIHRNLHRAIGEAIREGGQVILLLNRRGFSTHIQCPSCGEVVKCPECEIALTHHRTEEIALCHYCDYRIKAPNECPSCKFVGISYRGLGTQRLEAEIRARFPDVKCLRMDSDTMQSRGAHERALTLFKQGDVQILLGTQMIAKGLDFPNVTLVGVINADTALHLPDFRSAERTFHLVTQVAGRTGRGEKGGRVLVQTFNPDHPAIQAAVRHDYKAFADGELPIRRMFSYPPFASMARFVVRGPQEKTAEQFAQVLGQRLVEALDTEVANARVLGPAAAPFAKLRGKYRFQIQLQAPDADRLRAGIRRAITDLKAPDEIQWIVDIDPVDML